MTSDEACSGSKRLASTSFRRQLPGKLLVQQWRGSSGNVRLSHLLILPTQKQTQTHATKNNTSGQGSNNGRKNIELKYHCISNVYQ